jgi:hypothetical protein
MLLRCAAKTMMAPPMMMAGLALAAGAVATLALGATVVGGAMLAKRLHEERQGWRSDADDPLPPDEPVVEAPGA